MTEIMSDEFSLRTRLSATVVKELIVGVTGLMLVLFVGAHLAGNILIYAGPASYNAYAAKLHAMGPLLWFMRLGLLVAFVTHIATAINLDIVNRQARVNRYAVNTYLGRKTVATRTMLASGIIIFLFVLFHIYDFALSDKTGPASIVPGVNNGQSLGLFGVVWNAFRDPVRVLFYVTAACAVGFHLSHAVASVWVTVGILRDEDTPVVDLVARILGVAVAVGFSSIPICVFLQIHFFGGGPI